MVVRATGAFIDRVIGKIHDRCDINLVIAVALLILVPVGLAVVLGPLSSAVMQYPHPRPYPKAAIVREESEVVGNRVVTTVEYTVPAPLTWVLDHYGEEMRRYCRGDWHFLDPTGNRVEAECEIRLTPITEAQIFRIEMIRTNIWHTDVVYSVERRHF